MTESHRTSEQRNWWHRNWPNVVAPLAVLAIVGLIVGVPFYFINKGEQRCEQTTEQCGLYAGDRVVSALDGTPGMVTSAYCGKLRVRFAASAARTDTRLLRRDGLIEHEPYATVTMNCFEVSRAE